jgi:glycine/D-amino acid oxidase-like deaminating enzyme
MAKIDPNMGGVHWVNTSKEAPVDDTRAALKPEYDLVVVGAGFCGLSIALHSAENGLSVLLLEAGTIGCGASGRNGGIVVPHFAGTILPSHVQEILGKHRAERLCDIVSGGPSFVFSQIRNHQIRCDPEQTGWIQPAHSRKSLARVKRAQEEWNARGIETKWLQADDLNTMIGAGSTYLGAWYGATGGTVNPAALANGLGRVASEHGVHIRQNCAVTAIEAYVAGKIIKTAREEFRSRKVVIATNGYTSGLYPGLDRSVIAIRLYHALTRPLTGDELKITMPGRIPFTDLRKSGGFSRLDVDNRVLTGGAVLAFPNARNYGLKHSQRRIAEIFPDLAGIEIEKYWEGYCAFSNNHLPSVQVLEKDVYAVIGFSTRGVSLAQNLGREVAAFLAENLAEADLPVEFGQGQPIVFQRTKTFLGGFAFPAYQAVDYLGLS